MRGRTPAALTLSLALYLAAAVHAQSTSVPPRNQPVTGPPSALENLARAYRDLSADEIGAVLTDDYRFHAVGQNLLRFTTGSARTDEMGAVRGMLNGVTRDGKVLRPKADSIGVWFDGVAEGLDPEHPDSTEQYRVLTVARAEFGIRLADGNRLAHLPGLNVFHVVRGDAAVLAPGQTANPKGWYIRRWLEDLNGLRTALRERPGECGEQDPPAPTEASAANLVRPAAPLALAIRALANPACAALRIVCDLPGSESAKVDVYDVSGRLVNTRPLEVKAPGQLAVDAGAGTRLLPGVYWVRLNQAARRPSTRMVVVAR